MTYRPELHLTADQGVLDAPAGVLLDGSTWHVFYQYRPAPGEASRWGHSFTEEFPFDWLECDDALAPVGGEIALRAGAVAPGDDGVNLYFTSVTSAGTTIRLAKFTGIDNTCTVSDDPATVDRQVIRHDQVMGDTDGYRNFRSPCVVPDWDVEDVDTRGPGWLMLALTGPTELPVPVVLRSPDGVDWRFEGPLEFDGDTGLRSGDAALPPVVSPRIIRLRDEVDGEIYDILFATIEAGASRGTEIAGYLVGHLRGSTFEVVTGFRRLDFGHDFTRPRNTNYTMGTSVPGADFHEAIIFGVLNGRGRLDDASVHHSWQEEGWANALSLPRRLTLQDGIIYQTPPVGLPDAVSNTERARMWTGVLEVPEGSRVTVTVLDGAGEPAAVITHSSSELRLDRSMARAFNHTYEGDLPAVAQLMPGEEDSLTVVVDGSTIEVFADSGLVTMASRAYVEGGCSGFRVEAKGDAAVLNSFERAGS